MTTAGQEHTPHSPSEALHSTGNSPDVLFGSSPQVARLREKILRIGRTPGTTVFLEGCPGAPFEQVARAIHECSRQPQGSFLTLTPGEAGFRSDLESALDSGPDCSLLLCAVDRLEARDQELLASALKLGQRPRILAQSHGDLESATRRGLFREDLLYRINVLVLHVPTLSERASDVPALALRMLSRTGSRLGKHFTGLAPRALEALQRHSFGGDLLELEAAMTIAAVRAEGRVVQACDVAGALDRGHEAPRSGPRSLGETEEIEIRRVLEEVAGNRSRAARLLGIHRATLYNKLRAYGIG